MNSLPYITIQCPIPLDQRERVWVDKFGAGTTFDRLLLGTIVTGVGVLLDTGERITVVPNQLRQIPPAAPLPDVLPSNVVRFAPRSRVTEGARR